MVSQRVRTDGSEQADDIGIVAKGENAGIRNVSGEKCLRPEHASLLVGPGRLAITGESVDEDDTLRSRALGFIV